jgi:signal peptidase I
MVVERSEITPTDSVTSGLGVQSAGTGSPGADPPGSGQGGDGPRPATPPRRRQGLEWLVLVACSLGVALLVRAFLIQAFYIPSESMVPTLHKDDRVLVNKLSYKLHDIHRGDIVVFAAPPGTATSEVKDLIKRVIGLPGESIEGRDGNIYIDGRLIDEPYLPPAVRSREFPPEKVPAGHYWVLGDNRQDSRDSTFFKSIAQSAIVGRAFVRIWPVGNIGLI